MDTTTLSPQSHKTLLHISSLINYPICFHTIWPTYSPCLEQKLTYIIPDNQILQKMTILVGADNLAELIQKAKSLRPEPEEQLCASKIFVWLPNRYCLGLLYKKTTCREEMRTKSQHTTGGKELFLLYVFLPAVSNQTFMW